MSAHNANSSNSRNRRLMKQQKRYRLFGCFLSAAMLVGCMSVVTDSGPIGQSRQWFNPTLPIHLQTSLFDQESAFCEKAAYRWQPVPEVVFTPGLVRQVNDKPNVSVDGATLSATPPLTFDREAEQSYINIATGVGVMRGPSLKSRREQRDHLQCLKSLGWQGVSETWDGTPPALNETFGINARVMELQRSGFSHPFVARDRILMIDLANSTGSESTAMLKVAVAEFSGSNPVTFCEFSINRVFVGSRLSGFCGGAEVAQTSIGLGSPVDHWLKRYYPNF